MGEVVGFPAKPPQTEAFEQEHVAGTIGALSVVLGPLGAENGLPLWGVVIRQPGKPDHRVMRGTFNAALGDFAQFQRDMADYALIVRDTLYLASQRVTDLNPEPDGAA